MSPIKPSKPISSSPKTKRKLRKVSPAMARSQTLKFTCAKKKKKKTTQEQLKQNPKYDDLKKKKMAPQENPAENQLVPPSGRNALFKKF
jgi:hypothetical protein